MPHSAVASAYDQIAERWKDDRFNADNGVALHSRALAFLPSPVSGYALNVGCGCNTRFNALIRSRGLSLEGVDISPRMVDLALSADPGSTVHLADVCTWQPAHGFKFITAWDSIWHVQLSQQRRLMLNLMSWLEPGGVLIFTAGGLDAPGEHTDAYMGPSVYYSTLGVSGILLVLEEGNALCRHLEYDQHPQKHLCVIAQRARA
jgi:predicted TPR repeat methyltransferase